MNLGICFSPAAALSKSLMMSPPAPSTQKTPPGPSGRRPRPSYRCHSQTCDSPWPIGRDQRPRVPWLRKVPKAFGGFIPALCTLPWERPDPLFWAASSTWILQCSEDVRVPHRAQLAHSQDITQARNTHLLLEANEILGSVCYTALAGEC